MPSYDGDLTKTYHKAPYATIDPTRPELSQAGRTVLVTGGGIGLGFAIARSFIKASAARVIIVGRRAPVIEDAVSKLTVVGAELGSPTVVVGKAADVGDIAAMDELWGWFEKEGIVIDVLVLNHASGGMPNTILDQGRDQVWSDFVTNVRAPLDLAERFAKQTGKGASSRKFIVSIGSSTSFRWTTAAPHRPTYGLTKVAGQTLMQQIAKDVKPEELQIVNVHPGGIFTEMAMKDGHTLEGLVGIVDDEDLPGHWTVWAATPEAEFLHGRFVQANWDIDELRSGVIAENLRNDPLYLKTSIRGIP